jgi:hypothetical protein
MLDVVAHIPVGTNPAIGVALRWCRAATGTAQG